MAMRTLLVLVLLAPVPTLAAGPVEEAEQLVAQMNYQKALKTVGRILASPKSQPEDLAAAFRLQGMCMVGLGKTEKAIESFRKLLSIQPTFRIPDSVTPRVKAPFFKALSMKGMKPIALSHEVPKPPKRLGGFALRVNVESNPFGMIHAVRLRYQPRGGSGWSSVRAKVKRPGLVGCKLPKKLRATEIDYFFEAVNKKGGVLGRSGSEEHPYQLGGKTAAPAVAAASPEPKEPEKPTESTKETSSEITDFEPPAEETPAAREQVAVTQPESPKEVVESTPVVPPEPPPAEAEPERENGAWYTTWWFWTAVGVVAAGAVTGVVIAATAGGEPGSPSAYHIYMDW